MRLRMRRRIQKVSSVYLTAVLEYLVQEVLELSSEITKFNKKILIQPKYINQALKYDQELNQLTKNVIIPEVTNNVTYNPSQ